MWRCVFGHSKFLGCTAILAVSLPVANNRSLFPRCRYHFFDSASRLCGAASGTKLRQAVDSILATRSWPTALVRAPNSLSML